jgi:hypothetical protein
MQDSMKKIYDEGTAEDVVDLISDFKKENSLLSNKITQSSDNVIDIKKAEKKQALTAVVGKHGAVNPAHAVKDDYDSAFDEATRN